MPYYRLNVRLNTDDPIDATIIEILNRLGDRGKSRWVRHILHAAATAPTNDQLLTEIRAIRHLLETLPLHTTASTPLPETTPNDEPPAAAANLGGLLQRLKEQQ
jgi:hypothetical protein